MLDTLIERQETYKRNIELCITALAEDIASATINAIGLGYIIETASIWGGLDLCSKEGYVMVSLEATTTSYPYGIRAVLHDSAEPNLEQYIKHNRFFIFATILAEKSRELDVEIANLRRIERRHEQVITKLNRSVKSQVCHQVTNDV